MRAAPLLPLFGLVALTACSDDSRQSTKGRDAGIPRDAGPAVSRDGGDETRDAGDTTTDSGVIDSGVDRDGGSDRDGGDTTTDSGVVDSGVEPDGGMPNDGGVVVPDSGIPWPDGGIPWPDGGIPWPDGGIPWPDGGIPWPDGGIPWPDGGIPWPDGGIPWPDGGIPWPDGGIPWPDGGIPDATVGDGGTGTVASFVSSQMIMNLFPPVAPDPLLGTYALSFNNPSAAPETLTIVSSALVFFDGQRTTFPVMPGAHSAGPGASMGTFLKTPGSGTAVMNPQNYCNTVATVTVDLSNGQTVMGTASITCIN